MKQVEFDAQIERMVSFYGDKAYPRERIEMIYRAVKYYHPEVWQLAVDMIIADCERAPMLSKIKEFLRLAQNQLPDKETIDPNAHIRAQLNDAAKAARPCYKCFNTGLIVVYRKWQGLSEAALACNCQWGEVVTKLPEFRTVRRIQAIDPFYYVLGFDPNKAEKLLLYRDVPWRHKSQDALNEISEIYFTHEIHIVPVYWSPSGVRLSGFEPGTQDKAPADPVKWIRDIAASKELKKSENDHEWGNT